MSGFLDEAERLHRMQHSGIADSKEAFADVFSAMDELQYVYAKSDLELDNIEHLFGAIEMGLTLGRLGSRSTRKLNALRENLITVILRTLEFTMNFPVVDQHIYPGPPYDDFMQMLSDGDGVRSNTDRHKLSFITFNYDLALDYSLHHQGYRFGYCLDGKLPAGLTPLLKLHGSLNWAMCKKCKSIVPYHVRDVHFRLNPTTENVHFNVTSLLSGMKHCDKAMAGVPVLVPPTWNKGKYPKQIVKVWQRAASVLADAQNIFVVGYSFPESDAFFRYLFALGTLSDTRIHRLWVFDPDENHSVEQRYRTLIGRSVQRRFQFHNLTFEEAVPEIGKALAKA
ncbi:MAG: hypothetical protein ABIE42_09540 [Candidatus Eisenbacteria bacterium]